MSVFWYLNVPLYDFLAKNRIGLSAPEVVLVEPNEQINSIDAPAVIEKLSQSGVEAALIVRDSGTGLANGNIELPIPVPKSSSIRLINAYPITERNAERHQDSPNEATWLLEPSTDYDGIARIFDPKRYGQFGLECTECNVRLRAESTVADSRTFLINYLNDEARLPKVSTEQLLNDWVPKGVLAGKVAIVDLTSASIKEIFRTNLFIDQKISFPYYIASVINTQVTQQKHYILSPYAVLFVLVLLSLLMSLFLRDVSLNFAIALVGFSAVTLLGVNALTLGFLNTFVPVVEFLTLITVYLFYAVKARNDLVFDDLKASNGILELALAETHTQLEMKDTELCSGLYRFFGRVSDIQGLSVFEIHEQSEAQCVLTLDQASHSEINSGQLIEAISGSNYQAKHHELTDENGVVHSHLLIPIKANQKVVACIAINISHKDAAAVAQLIKLSESYMQELSSEVITWLQSKSSENQLDKTKLTISGRRRTLAHRNRGYVSELMTRYKQAKRNYNHLESAVAIYDIYGNLISINASAEELAQKNGIVWYETPISQILPQLTKLASKEGQSIVNRVLMSGVAHRFTLTGELKEYIGVLSHRKIVNQVNSGSIGRDGVRSFLCLEVINVSNIGTSARLKDSYVRDLTNQIKQDLSKLTLLVDQLSMTDRDTQKYNYLSDVLEKLSDRVRGSKKYIIDLNKIENSTHYSVSVLEKLDEALERFEHAFSEKSINLIYNKPSFVNQIVLDYRSLEFIFNYMFELLVDDSLVNSELTVSIQESASDSGRMVSIIIKNHGYGLPQDFLIADRENSDDHPLKRCEEFAKEHGGRFDFSTIAGEGIEFCLDLPIKSQLH